MTHTSWQGKPTGQWQFKQNNCLWFWIRFPQTEIQHGLFNKIHFIPHPMTHRSWQGKPTGQWPFKQNNCLWFLIRCANNYLHWKLSRCESHTWSSTKTKTKSIYKNSDKNDKNTRNPFTRVHSALVSQWNIGGMYISLSMVVIIREKRWIYL